MKMNPGMTQQEIEAVVNSMKVFSDFMEETKFTREFVADMVVVDREQLAYLGQGGFKI